MLIDPKQNFFNNVRDSIIEQDPEMEADPISP